MRQVIVSVGIGLAFAAAALTVLHDQKNAKRPPGMGDGGGRATIEPEGPVLVGAPGTWTVTYVAGGRGVGAGGGVVLHLPLFWEWTEPQTDISGYPGYSTVHCSDPSVRLDLHANSELHYLMATVAEGSLSPGDSIRFVYGDTLGGDAPRGRAFADHYAEKVQEFLVKVDGDGDGFFTEIGQSPSVPLVAGPAATLLIRVKGEADRNETTWMTVAALDRFGNRARMYAGTIRFSHKWNVLGTPMSYTFTPMDEGAHGFPIQFTAPGYQTIGVVEQGGVIHGTSNPIRVRSPGDEEPYSLLWADIHTHSRLSDGTGEPADLYRYARDVSNLDVASVTDHDHHGLRPLRAADWNGIRERTAEFYAPGRFVTFLGYEWTNWVYGHRNVYYRDGDGPLLTTADSLTDSPDELWAALRKSGKTAMTIAHHTGGGPVPTDWSIRPPPDLERLVEICSIHGSSECFGCPREIYNATAGSFVRDALGRGDRLGFAGSGDGHTGHPGETESVTGGLMGVFAAERTRDSVWEALGARRTYATSGERILLRVRLGDHWMGEEIDAAGLPDILSFRVGVCGTAPLDMIELFENDAPVDTLFGSGESIEGMLEAEKKSLSSTYYYVRVLQMDGGLAWSSPIWVGP